MVGLKGKTVGRRCFTSLQRGACRPSVFGLIGRARHTRPAGCPHVRSCCAVTLPGWSNSLITRSAGPPPPSPPCTSAAGIKPDSITVKFVRPGGWGQLLHCVSGGLTLASLAALFSFCSAFWMKCGARDILGIFNVCAFASKTHK